MNPRDIVIGFTLCSGLSSFCLAGAPTETISLPLPGSSVLASPKIPTLLPAEDEVVRYNYWKMDREHKEEQIALTRSVATWLTDPRCQDFRSKDASAAMEFVRGTVRQQMRISGTFSPRPLIPIPTLNSVDPIAKRLKGAELKAYETGRDKSIGKMTGKILESSPVLGLAVSNLRSFNEFAGYQVDTTLPQEVDRKSWNRMVDLDRICRPEKLFDPSSGRNTNESADGIRLLYDQAKRGDSITRSVAEDRDTHGLGLKFSRSLDALVEEDPSEAKNVERFREIDRDSRPQTRRSMDEQAKANPRQARAIEARQSRRKRNGPAGEGRPGVTRNGPASVPNRGVSSEQEDEQAWSARVLTGSLEMARQVDRDLANRLEKVKSAPADTPEETKLKAEMVEKLTEERLTEARRYRQMAGLALNSLSNLGLDPGLVRDLSLVTDSGFQVGEGIIMLTNASNPMGWLNMLSGLTNLLGGFGPNPNMLILEQLHEIRKELAEFRRDVRVEFASLRGDVLSTAQRVLDRIEDLEYNLSREIGEVKTQVRWNEYRLGQIEGQISALSHQLLTRFAELHQKDLITLLAASDLNLSDFALLEDEATRTELRQSRFHDAASSAYASAVYHAASRTMAGGDFEIPAAYGVAPGRLDSGGPGSLLPLAQHPTAPWSEPNDFLELARSAGLEPLPARPSVPGLGVLNRRGLAPDNTRVVNPLAWSLAVSTYLGLAADSPKYFKSRHGLRRGLAEIYLRGEDFNDMANRLADPSDGGIFRALLESQVSAIDRLDRVIRDKATGVADKLGGIDPWRGIQDQRILDGYLGRVSWLGTPPKWQERTKAQGYAGTETVFEPGSKDGPTFEPAELRKVVDRGLIPRVFCLASLIHTNSGISGPKSRLGGSIELKLVDLDLPEDKIVLRGARREATGFLGTGPGKYHDVYLYDGPVYATFEARYKANTEATFDIPILRKRIPTRRKVRLLHDNEKHFLRIDDDRSFEAYRRIIPYMNNGDWKFLADFTGFNPSAFLKEEWTGLKADFIASDREPIDADILRPEEIENELRTRMEAEISNAMSTATEEAKKNLGLVGDAIREIVGCQWTLYRFVQLSLPEASRDPELFDLLLGGGAAWGGESVMSRFKPGMKLVEVVGNDVNIPLTQAMRIQTSKLEAKLAEVLTRHQSSGEPFRHPVVEGALIRIAGMAKRLDINLEEELRELGVETSRHWVIKTVHDVNHVPAEGRVEEIR